MEETCVLRPIAHVHSEFPGKFGIPRQSGVVPELRSELIFTPDDSIDQGNRVLGMLGKLKDAEPVGPSSDPMAKVEEEGGEDA